MTFGRMNNMRRRASRPDESYHRNQRRRSIDRSVMLNTGRPRQTSAWKKMLRALFKLITRR